MLLGQDGRRHQHRHLLAVHDRLEGRPDGHLGLAVADVAAEQAVHRLGLSPCPLDLPMARSWSGVSSYRNDSSNSLCQDRPAEGMALTDSRVA